MASPLRSIAWPEICVNAEGVGVGSTLDNLIDCRRLAMISLDRMVGWFPHTHREWIEFIIVALLLWLLMVVAISELEVIPI
jgi:hypothetical protein